MTDVPLTPEGYGSIAAWFSAYADRFRGAGGALPGPLRFKLAHSGRVAANAAKIAAGLALPDGEAALARAAGLLHDAGRFIQFRDHASFIDARSIDHGAAGRALLEAETAHLFADRAAFARLLLAVELHNRKSGDLPGGLTSGERSLLLLVRDADKLDIMDTMLACLDRGDAEGLAEMLPDLPPTTEVTPGVAEAAARGEVLSLNNLKTLGDVLLMIAAWFPDLNYGASTALALERGCLRRLRARLPDSAAVDQLFRGLEKAAGAPGADYRL